MASEPINRDYFNATVCKCSHAAIRHHGVDGRARRDAGCQENSMRDDWCRCELTATDVVMVFGMQRCQTCFGPQRETVGLICESCARDYGALAGKESDR